MYPTKMYAEAYQYTQIYKRPKNGQQWGKQCMQGDCKIKFEETFM